MYAASGGRLLYTPSVELVVGRTIRETSLFRSNFFAICWSHQAHVRKDTRLSLLFLYCKWRKAGRSLGTRLCHKHTQKNWTARISLASGISSPVYSILTRYLPAESVWDATSNSPNSIKYVYYPLYIMLYECGLRARTHMKRRVLLMKRSTADMFPNAIQRDTKNKAPILHIWREGNIYLHS